MFIKNCYIWFTRIVSVGLVAGRIKLILLCFVYFFSFFEGEGGFVKSAFLDYLMIIFCCEKYRMLHEFAC